MKNIDLTALKRIYVDIPANTGIKYIVIDKLKGYVLENRLAAADAQEEPVQIRKVPPDVVTHLTLIYADQRMKEMLAQSKIIELTGRLGK